MSVRILHILDHSAPLHSGYAFRTLALLREQRALGWDTVHLTTPRQGDGNDEGEEQAAGFTFHRTRLGSRQRLAGFREAQEVRATAARIEQLVQRFEPDVLHAHSPVLNALPALWVGRRHRIPVVYEVRASWEDAAVDHGTTSEGSVRYRLSRASETFALRRADHITTICEGLKQEIAGRGIDGRRITVVPNAVDITAFRPGRRRDSALARRLGLQGATVLGFAGSFYGYEGLDLLLDAARILRQRFPALKVLLVGGGPQEAALRAQAARIGLEGHVLFAGRIPHEQVAAHYDLIDVLVYPRRSMRLTELVTPLKPLEAMAQARMLVASDVGGHRELIRDGETGHLFAAGQIESLVAVLQRLLRSPDSWERVRVQARRFVESQRTWTASAARYAEVYGRVLARPLRAADVPRVDLDLQSTTGPEDVRHLRHS
jgi:PEP-CTERM/exosortase A-associated glycosyltransferase